MHKTPEIMDFDFYNRHKAELDKATNTLNSEMRSLLIITEFLGGLLPTFTILYLIIQFLR